MLKGISEFWPSVVLVACAVGGVTSYWLKVLQIRELKHKLRELERNKNQQDSRIHIPTDAEVSKYGKERRFLEKIRTPGLLLVGALFIGGWALSRREVLSLKSELEDSRYKIARLSSDLENTKRLFRDLRVEVIEPRDGSEVGEITRVAGRIYISSESHAPVGPYLEIHQIRIVILLREVSHPEWWVQPDPFITDKGYFEGRAYLSKDRVSMKEEFEIIVIAIPKDTLLQTDYITTLPFFYTASNQVIVNRSR